jgi:hypothetical protein
VGIGVDVGIGVFVGIGAFVGIARISIIAGVVVDRMFSPAWSLEPVDNASVMFVYVIWVGTLPVTPIAVKFNVPSLVVVRIVFAGSDPIETEAASVSLVATGPSIVIGKAVVLGIKAFVFTRASFVGSYLIWNFTKDTKFDPGLTMISIETGSPIVFRSGAFFVELGENESDVEALARLRVSCLRCIQNKVSGMVAISITTKIKMNIFLFMVNNFQLIGYPPSWVKISLRKRL